MDLNNFINKNNANSLNISNIINTKNKTISGDRFYVGEGILKCDNYFISLDSICRVEMGRRQESASSFFGIIVTGIIVVVLSLLFFTLNIQMGMKLFLIGAIIIVFGFWGINRIRKSNEKIPYSMTVHLSDNSTFAYYSDKDFVLRVMDVIQTCINDRRGGYWILNNEEKIEKIDNSIHIGEYKGEGDIIGGTGATKNAGNTYTTNNNDISSEEWMNLEKYFIMRQQEFPINDRNYKICNNLITYSREKNTTKLIKYLKVIGKDTIRTLFTASKNVAAMEVVRPIIQKLLS